MNGAERTLPAGTLAEMVAAVDGDWTVADATLTDSGHLPVYRLALETPAGPRRAVLKAEPPELDTGVALEARLLRGLADRTDLAVPEVYGAVDEHPDLPAPFLLVAELPGETVPREDLDRFTDSGIRHVARQVGRHLAALHAVDAVDAFGYLTLADHEPCRGGRPQADFGGVAVADPTGDWPARLRGWVDDTCDGLAETRFADLAEDVRSALHDRVDDLEGPFRPALGHVDGAIENHLLAVEGSGSIDRAEVVGLLDWAFTLAVPPAYDLLFVEQSLAGGLQKRVPGAPEFREPVRAGLRAGYRETGDAAVLDRLDRHRDCYELFARANALNVFEPWFDHRGTDEETVDATAENYRAAVRTML